MLVEALHRLIVSAESRRGWLPADSAEREFYLGVEAAARDALHPERAGAKPAGWLQLETGDFRDGYERTSVLVVTAVEAEQQPFALELPEFEPAQPN